jgi:hypothetical protein
MNVNGLASNGHFVQQEIPAALATTSLGRVLGPTRQRCPSRTSGTLVFVLLGQALRAH